MQFIFIFYSLLILIVYYALLRCDKYVYVS
jgi:hypothetical protein